MRSIITIKKYHVQRYCKLIIGRLVSLTLFKQNGGNFTRFKSKIQMELGEVMAKNIAKTARRQFGGPHLLVGEYLRSWTNLKVNYRNIDAGKLVLAMFLN